MKENMSGELRAAPPRQNNRCAPTRDPLFRDIKFIGLDDLFFIKKKKQDNNIYFSQRERKMMQSPKLAP